MQSFFDGKGPPPHPGGGRNEHTTERGLAERDYRPGEKHTLVSNVRGTSVCDGPGRRVARQPPGVDERETDVQRAKRPQIVELNISFPKNEILSTQEQKRKVKSAQRAHNNATKVGKKYLQEFTRRQNQKRAPQAPQ